MYIFATTTTLCEGARIRSNCNSSISYCQPAGRASRALRLYGKPDQPQSTSLPDGDRVCRRWNAQGALSDRSPQRHKHTKPVICWSYRTKGQRERAAGGGWLHGESI